MENRTSFIFMLSLKEIALRRVAVILWNEYDNLTLIGSLHFNSMLYWTYEKAWRETVESKVTDKISKLILPESLRKQMIQILKPIGLQIFQWKLFHKAYLSDSNENIDEPVLEQLCWTSIGTVDYKKTAEELIRCDVIDIVSRYKLACLYCLDDFIPVFWKEFPEEIKKKFYKGEDVSLVERPHLQFCWPYILKGEQSKLDCIARHRYRDNMCTFHRYAFEYSANNGNKAAAEYFFQKLTHEEKEACLLSAAHNAVVNRNHDIFQYSDVFPKEKVSDVLCYLLSLMAPEQQMQVFKKQPHGVLRCFLDFPWQDFFLKIADIIWSFLTPNDFDMVLRYMNRSIENLVYYFPKLFQEFFLRCPSDFKKQFVDQECSFSFYFPEIFNIQDAEIIKVIFRNVDVADRMRLVSTEDIFKLFYNCILRGRWHMVEVCLQEATLSKVDRERLKKAFMKFLIESDRGQIKWRKRKWKRFFQFLDETDANVNIKRSLEDDILNKAKQICT